MRHAEDQGSTCSPIGHRPAAAVLLVCVCLVVALTRAPVIAGAGEPTQLSADWASVLVNVQATQDGPYCLVGGQLPTDTPLPARVEIAVPSSSTAQWVGEVSPETGGAEQQLEYEVTKRGPMDVYTTTLQKSRYGQVEAIVPGLIEVSGDNYNVDVNWVAPSGVAQLLLACQIPPNAQIAEPVEGARTEVDSTGARFYYVTLTNLKKGDEARLAFTYSIPTTTVQNEADGGGGLPAGLWIVLGLALVAVAALVVVVVRQRSRGGAEGE